MDTNNSVVTEGEHGEGGGEGGYEGEMVEK